MDGNSFTVGITLQILYQLEKKLHNDKKIETENTDMIKKYYIHYGNGYNK